MPLLIPALAAALALAAGSAPAVATIAAPAAEPTPAATPAVTPAAIGAYVDQAMTATGRPGLSVVVTRRDKILYAAGHGHDTNGNPITARTPMRVASLSKSFTAMAVMTLVEEGKIALDDPVVRWLPEFRMADPRAARITVRHLLNQTSGLSDGTIDIPAAMSARSLTDYVAVLRSGRLAAAPGTRWAYCNANYHTAARLVEVVTGSPFHEQLRRRVFAPLGMTASTIRNGETSPPGGYNSVFGLWVPRSEVPDLVDGGGSGSVVTNAEDMGRWLISQNGHGRQLVSAAGLRTMHTPSGIGGEDYGMGWEREGDGLLEHGGTLLTFSAGQAIDPATGYGFAVMANSTALADDTDVVLNGLVALSRGRTPPEPGGRRQQTDLALALIALVATALGVLGVLRSARWAARRARTRPWWIWLRLVPALLPVALLVAYPDVLAWLLGGRTVTWQQLLYLPATLTLTLVVAAAAGAGTVGARLLRLRRARSKR